MPKTSLADWSTTAGDNTDINSININTGAPPSGVDNAIREVMKQVKVDLLTRPKFVLTRAALKALDTTNWPYAFFDGSPWAFTSGDYATLITADAGEGLYVKADAIATSSGAWVRQRGIEVLASWFGFSTSATAADNTTAINRAISLVNTLGGGIVRIGAGTFAVNTILMKDGVTLQGAGRLVSVLSDTRADTNPVITSFDNTATMTWAKVLDIKIQKLSGLTFGAVVDMTSWQWGELGRCWIQANSVVGTECVRMRGLYTAGPVFTTEGTYNRVHHNYMGLCAFGIRMGPNSNSCWIEHNRIQPNVVGGTGIFVGSTGALEGAVSLFPNQISIRENSVERTSTGGMSGIRGVYIETVARTISVVRNRFEGAGLANGVYVEAGASGWAAENDTDGNTGDDIVGISSTFHSVQGATGVTQFAEGVRASYASSILDFTGAAGSYRFDKPIALTGAAPAVTFLDTDTGADSSISANSATGSLTLSADTNGEVASSSILMLVDGTIRVNLTSTKLDVNLPIEFAPGSSVTPTSNGDVVFELTSNTLLTIKAKGSDGTIRSGTVTLA